MLFNSMMFLSLLCSLSSPFFTDYGFNAFAFMFIALAFIFHRYA